MDSLWIFNPENDIALGNNLRYFTPPRNAMLLRNHGAMLPAWIAKPGDMVFTENSTDAEWLDNMSDILKKEISILTPGNISRVSHVCPWGWSRAIVENLARTGISRNLMPDPQRIERIRALSHRRSSVTINRKLLGTGMKAALPVEFSDIGSLRSYLDAHNRVVMKSPWSSSGRGVIYSEKMDTARMLSLAEGIIKNQGSVMIEQMFNKIIDFAMLFKIGTDGAQYIGLSVFDTLSTGNYTGNLIASESHLSGMIGRFVGHLYLEQLKQSLENILTELIGDAYIGVCGIDMMVHKNADGTYALAPCVELNLRHTMGYIAHCLARDIIAADKTGEMNVTYTGNKPDNHPAETDIPRFDSANRLVSGSLSLVPPNPYFTITLRINNSAV